MVGETMSDCGFVFAATGAKYAILARRAARTLRRVMPDAAVDLFTDQPVEDPVFDRIHPVQHAGKRPKMEALRRSRFGRTVYLDCDVIAVCAADELFALLEKCDVIGAQALNRGPWTRRNPGIPASFAQINSGVLGIRGTPEVRALMSGWEDRMVERGDNNDQPALREVLWNSDLRLGILAPHYNLLFTRLLHSWPGVMGAPRFLHCRQLHKGDPGDPMRAFTLEEGIGSELAEYVRVLLQFEPTIRPRITRQPETPYEGLGRLFRGLEAAVRRQRRTEATARGEQDRKA